jgi:CRP-like cAMP-binding protein
LHEGDFFGEISLLTGAPRTATVRSVSDVTLFVLNREHLGDVLKEHSNLTTQIATKLVERQQNLSSLGIVDLEKLTLDELLEIRFVCKSNYGLGFVARLVVDACRYDRN